MKKVSPIIQCSIASTFCINWILALCTSLSIFSISIFDALINTICCRQTGERKKGPWKVSKTFSNNLKPKLIFDIIESERDENLLSYRIVASSGTRFGEILPLWRISQLVKGLFSKIITYFGKNIAILDYFHCCKWPKNEKAIESSGHTGRKQPTNLPNARRRKTNFNSLSLSTFYSLKVIFLFRHLPFREKAERARDRFIKEAGKI